MMNSMYLDKYLADKVTTFGKYGFSRTDKNDCRYFTSRFYSKENRRK
jgi:hypothetical protein